MVELQAAERRELPGMIIELPTVEGMKRRPQIII
jgi:hypothetical protein